MDRGKRSGKLAGPRKDMIYMDLKDIIREHALPYFPAKSIFRFQAVCRDWKLQVSTPFFAHTQSLCFRSISGIFCQNPIDPPSFISVDPKSCGVPDPSLNFLPEPVIIRSSSNGLLCCQGISSEKPYYVCNVATQKWKELPKPNSNHGSDPATILIFEPSLFNFAAEYKLVCAYPSSDFDDATEFEIFTSGDGKWRVCGEICFGKSLVTKSGIHVDGVVYWKTREGSVLAFDLNKDRSFLIQGAYTHRSALGKIDGKLCTAYSNGRSVTLNVLANVHSNTMHMNSTARTWEKKCCVDLSGSVMEGSVGTAAVVFVIGGVMLIQSRSGIYLYDFQSKAIKALGGEGSDCGDGWCVPYVNSLVGL